MRRRLESANVFRKAHRRFARRELGMRHIEMIERELQVPWIADKGELEQLAEQLGSERRANLSGGHMPLHAEDRRAESERLQQPLLFRERMTEQSRAHVVR